MRSVERLDKRTSVHDLDPWTVSVALGWTGQGEYLTWSGATKMVSHAGTVVGVTSIQLEAEPINATTAGDHRCAGRMVVKSWRAR